MIEVKEMSRFVVKILVVVLLLAGVAIGEEAASNITLKSPNEAVEANIFIDDTGRLSYTVKRGNSAVINKSDMGIIVNKVDLGTGIKMGAPKYSTHNQRYPWRGVKSEAIDHYNSAILPFCLLYTSDAADK